MHLYLLAAGDALSVLAARLAAMEAGGGSGSGSSQPQRAPRPGRRERAAAAGASKLANGTGSHGAAGGHEPAAAVPAKAPAAAVETALAAEAKPVENGISPADKVTVEPAKRAPSGGGGSASAAEAAAASARAVRPWRLGPPPRQLSTLTSLSLLASGREPTGECRKGHQMSNDLGRRAGVQQLTQLRQELVYDRVHRRRSGRWIGES